VAEGPSINGRTMSHDFVSACPKPAKYLRLKIHKCTDKPEKPRKKYHNNNNIISLSSFKSLNFLDIKILLPRILP
jgi:hypothetical protein